jgi:hypothetical protein
MRVDKTYEDETHTLSMGVSFGFRCVGNSVRGVSSP